LVILKIIKTNDSVISLNNMTLNYGKEPLWQRSC